ncbi:unnamed protein product [Candidula unifasciata]|uniref:BTB domain-containing protein n=1 Tax=Candidula unifasciata TaxID=100452 RepID=A0A8S4A6S4_9EUPU|nr:unnamed protein product [Candidula unifasciata]
METDLEVKNVISELQSGHGSSLYSALIMIRTTLIKSKNSLSQLVQMGAVKLLVQVLEDRRRHKNQTKTTDIVMSILANLCLEEDVREQVVCCDGLSVIARVTLSAEQESIQNRGVRALANLALDVSNCEKIFQMEVPTFVAKRLMESEDVECRSTYCRALQLFGQTGKDARRLMEETQAIQALAALLKLDNRKLAVKSLRILSELSALCCCPSFTGQILAANILEELVTLADDEDSSSASCSLSIILRLCEQEVMRPALGSAGIISLLVKLMKSDKSCVSKVLALNALCLCTKEAVNRNKIQEAGGLELFISALNINEPGSFSEGQFSVLYDRIISSLVNFLYNDECLGKLLELGLVNILLEHLKRSCSFSSVGDDLKSEIDSFAVSFESCSKDRSGHLERGSKTNTAGVSGSTCHRNDNVAMEQNSAASSLSFSSTSMQTEDTRDDCKSNYLELPSSTPVLHYGMDTVVHGVPRKESNTDDEKTDCVVDKNNGEIAEDVEVELLTSSKNLENPLQHSDKARHTFSINSPTYQMETAWRLEDYTSGVTCKSFSLDPEPHRTSQHRSSSPYYLNTDLLQAPYSPLSAGASYYSPSQSSTSPSVLLSPVQSTFPSSPSSVSYRGSPTWGYSSPENENIPASAARLFSPHSLTSMSPLSLAYQNQFSPLSNTFPASPLHLFGERYSQSPTQSSQNSLFSQSTSFLEKSEPMDLDQLLVSSRTTSEALFTAVPLSQGTSEHIYSASEDDDDDNNACDSELDPSAIIGGRFANEDAELYPVAGCSTSDNINSSVKSVSGSVRLVSHKRGKTVNNSTCSTSGSADGQREVESAEASKRRRLNHTSLVIEPVRGHCNEGPSAESVSKALDHSCGSVANTGLNDDEEIKNVPQKFTVVNSATCSLKMESGFQEMLPVVTDGNNKMHGETEMQRPSSACSTLGFEKFRQRSFQRLASFPGKEKRLAKSPHFRKHLSGTLSSKPRITGSPAASLLPGTHISDSPYRSPFSEPAHNNSVSSQGIKSHSETKTHKIMVRSNSQDLFSSPLPENGSKASDVDGSRREVSSSSKKETAGSSDQSIDEARVKKIRRTTEANILILLARVSVKINPTQLLAESTVVSCLLGYIASAPNPIRRSCRILYRLCSNPHCFEKLILMQMPALIVKTLVLENDGTFPHSLFCSDNRNIMDFLPSSQGSECSGSQTSEFGRRMDFEFTGDAYSKLTSKVHSSIRSIFQNRHILVVDSEALRVNQGGDDIYEVGSSRAESCVRIGLELLYTLGAVAMSKFGEGEIQHLLARHSTQNKLACVISMLHLQVGWCTITRDKFFTKYSLWDKVLPCLFTPEAPVIRETIVAAVSLNVHLDNPGKLTKLVPKLPVCPDLESTSRHGRSVNKQFHEHVNSKSKSNLKPSLRNAEKTTLHADSFGTLKQISSEFVNDGLQICEQTGSESTCTEEVDNTASCSSKTDSFCPYQNMSLKHDVCFSVIDENKYIHKIRAQRKILVEKSEVFAAMFSGSYSESVQAEINVPDVSKDAFEFIIHYLHGCSSECPLIASLCMEYVKDQIVTAEMCVRSDSTESSSVAKQGDGIMCDEEQNVKEEMGAGRNDSICVVNDSSKSELEAGRKRTEASANISQVLEFMQSQDSLDSLTLEDRPHGDELPHACRKLSFYNPFPNGGNKDTGVQSSEEIARKCFDELITRCQDILELADRFLLHDLMFYPASVLAHVCLCEHTVEDIFHLACFYHLDSLAFDCIRETLMSCLPCSDAAAIYLQLAEDGYREQVHTALQWLVNRVK